MKQCPWREHLLENLLALSIKGLVDSGHAFPGNDPGDGARDGLHRVLERLLFAAPPGKLPQHYKYYGTLVHRLRCRFGRPRQQRMAVISEGGTALREERHTIYSLQAQKSPQGNHGHEHNAKISRGVPGRGVQEPKSRKASPLSLAHISPEEPLHNAVHSPQEHAALSIDVTPVLAFQRGACTM